MNIGRLYRKIVIEEPTEGTNTSGEWVQTWSTYHTAFANVQKVGGSENLQADKTTATNKVRFKIRFFAGINEDMRIVYGNAYYDITEIQELDREGLWLMANKRV